MKVLDTDILTLLFANHPRVTKRFREEHEEIAIAVITRIEVLQGRFASLMKAADGAELLRGQERLNQAERNLATVPKTLAVDAASAAQFDQLRQDKKIKNLRRADMLIAGIVLANKATLVTRNVKDFEKVPGLRVENWAD